MLSELVVAAFLIAFGLCIAGAGTHLYQMLAKQPAVLRYDGKTALSSLGNLGMSFVCGPYIMLHMGIEQGQQKDSSLPSVLIGALVAFSWAFVTGMLFTGLYIALRG
jgi:cytochrome c biogenesis protein CcdA